MSWKVKGKIGQGECQAGRYAKHVGGEAEQHYKNARRLGTPLRRVSKRAESKTDTEDSSH